MRTVFSILIAAFALTLAACGDDISKQPDNVLPNGTPGDAANVGNPNAGNNVTDPDAGNNTTDPDGGTASCPAEADCSGRECGPDPVCGTSCGTCGTADVCTDGMCVCVPNCDGKVCGDDGCGGSCGTCSGADVCNTQTGVCSDTCTPVTCAEIGAECGSAPNGCGGTLNCGNNCAAPQTCGGGGDDNVCGCAPQCSGRECGADGCGGVCGTCAANETCTAAGACVNEPPILTVVAPGAQGATANASFDIQWTDSDPDDDATIDLYWDNDARGEDGTLIVAGLSENDMADAYRWDVSTLADGDYWVYAVISDAFASTVDYSDGPLTKVTSVCSVASNGAVTVDVPAVDVTINVTIDGQAISAANTNDTDEGKIILRDPDTGETIDLGGVWDDTNDVSFSPYSLRLVAGEYDVYYAIVDEGTRWPLNNNRLLLSGVTIDSVNNVLNVDVPTVQASIDVTLNNEAISAANTNDTDEGKIVLRDPNTGEAIDFGGVWDDTNDVPFTPFNVRLVAGTYDAYYGIVDEGTSWPRNTNRLIQAGVDFSTSSNVTLNVGAVDASIDVTLSGQPVSAANTSDTDEGAIRLVDPNTADSIDLAGVWDDTNDVPFTPWQIRVVPGTYDAYYRIIDEGANWPLNTNRLLQAGVNVGAGTTTIDVPAGAVTIDVTLNGQPISAANTNDTDEGKIMLRDPATGETIDLAGVWDDTNDVPFTPWQINVVGGDYDIYYGIVDEGANWPLNANRRLQTSQRLTNGSSIVVNVPAAAYSLDVTLNGQPVSAANTNDTDEGALRLVDPTTGESIVLGGVWDDTNDVSFTPYQFRLVGGTYDVYYRIIDEGTSWPLNTNRLVRAGLNISNNGSSTIDIVTVDALIDVTLAGVPVSAANTNDTDEGKLVLRDPNTGETVDLGGVWDDTNDVPFTPYGLRLISGEYDIYYGIVDEGSSWPRNTNRRLQCVEF